MDLIAGRFLANKHLTAISQGCQIDFGCCDHSYKGENKHGLGPTPRTNDGVKCFKKVTGNEEIDSHREELRNYFGAQMDAIQRVNIADTRR
jgi:hypothetical protein